MTRWNVAATGLLAWGGALALPAGAQEAPPPIHQVDRILATAHDTFGLSLQVRGLSDGSVLVNDRSHYQLVLYDSSFRRITIVADTNIPVPWPAPKYQALQFLKPGSAFDVLHSDIVPYIGDTTAYLDWATNAFVLVKPDGTLGRTVAKPEVNWVYPLFTTSSPRPERDGFDRRGRVIYESGCPQPDREPEPPVPRGAIFGMGGHRSLWPDDSVCLLRFDPATLRVDTLAKVRLYRRYNAHDFEVVTSSNGKQASFPLVFINPIPPDDEWAVLADGSLAIIRDRDLHIDWVDPNGTARSTPPIPWHWERLTDSAKSAMIDSLRARADSVVVPDWHDLKAPPPSYVDPILLPDHMPAVKTGTALADADDHFWIQMRRPGTPAGGLVYDVIDRRGVVVDRLQLPVGTMIVGFGPGAAYLSSRVGAGLSLVSVALPWRR